MLLMNFIKHIERSNPLLLTAALGFAPWLLAPLAYGRWGVAASIVFMSISMAGLGFLILFYFGFFEESPSLRIAFAPGTGLIVQSGLLYLAVRFGINNPFLYYSICAVGVVGSVLLIRFLRQRPQDMSGWRRMPYLALVSIAVCLSFFMTDIRKNHVSTPEKGYSFLHADSTFNMSVTAAIKNGVKPWLPTSGVTPLVYHYGSHSIAGSHSKFTGASINDALLALAGVGLMVLLSVSIGLAALVSKLYGGDPIIGPIAGGASVFLHDSMRILLSGFRFVLEMFGFRVSDPQYFILCSGPRLHFFYSHSTVWGSIGLIVILSLTLWNWNTKEGLDWRRASALLFLTTLVFPLNMFAGIAVGGTLALVVSMHSIRDWSSWLYAALIVTASIGILWLVMGIGESQALSDFTEALPMGSPLASGLVSFAERTSNLFWIFLGVGIGLVPIGMFFSQKRSLLAKISLIVATGGFVFPAFFGMGEAGGYLYVIRFFFHFATVCSMAVLSRRPREWMEGQGTTTFIELSRGVWGVIALVSLIVLLVQLCGWVMSLYRIYPFPDGIIRIFAPLLTAILSSWLWRNVRQSITARSVSLVILICIILFQIAGTAKQIYIHAVKMPLVSDDPLLVLDSNEMKGLLHLRSISEPNDLCATNRNFIGDRNLTDFTFQVLYTPISERRFLIETPFPFAEIGSEEVRSDNRLLFESNDAAKIRNVINKHKIRYLVCAPGTDLALTINLTPWLYRVPDTGSLKIYEVRN